MNKKASAPAVSFTISKKTLIIAASVLLAALLALGGFFAVKHFCFDKISLYILNPGVLPSNSGVQHWASKLDEAGIWYEWVLGDAMPHQDKLSWQIENDDSETKWAEPAKGQTYHLMVMERNLPKIQSEK